MRQFLQLVLKKTDTYVVSILLIDFFITILVVSSFKLFFLVNVVALILINSKVKDLLVSVFILAIYCSFFFNPNKYYTVNIINGYELALNELRSGYSQGYGINLSNFFWFLSIVVLFREIVISKKKYYQLIFLMKTFLPVIFAFLLFFLIAVSVSSFFSPFPLFSFVWLLQYMQILIVSCLTFYFFKFKKKYKSIFFTLIKLMIVLEFILSVLQFMSQSSIGLVIEHSRGRMFATGLDENNSLFRVAGSFLFHNQLGLITLINLIMLLPELIKSQFNNFKDKKFLPAYYFMGFITIIFTQSRSVWLGSLLVAAIYLFIFKDRFKIILKKLNIFKVATFLIFFVSSVSFIVIPRFLLSVNTFYRGAGGYIRIKLIKEGIEVLKQNPLFGFGVGTNEYVLFRNAPLGVMSVFPTVVHWGFLQLALEVGLVGLLCFIFPFIFILNKIKMSFIKTIGKSFSYKKCYNLVFISGLVIILIYYTFLPHVGIVEFQFLGLLIGVGLASINSQINNLNLLNKKVKNLLRSKYV